MVAQTALAAAQALNECAPQSMLTQFSPHFAVPHSPPPTPPQSPLLLSLPIARPQRLGERLAASSWNSPMTVIAASPPACRSIGGGCRTVETPARIQNKLWRCCDAHKAAAPSRSFVDQPARSHTSVPNNMDTTGRRAAMHTPSEGFDCFTDSCVLFGCLFVNHLQSCNRQNERHGNDLCKEEDQYSRIKARLGHTS